MIPDGYVVIRFRRSDVPELAELAAPEPEQKRETPAPKDFKPFTEEW